MNPCPCGHYGDLRRECRCAPNQVQKYRNRLSGPLMDRIDIHVEVPGIDLKDLTESSFEESSAKIRERVTHARFIQLKRFSDQPKVSCNARMTRGCCANTAHSSPKAWTSCALPSQTLTSALEPMTGS